MSEFGQVDVMLGMQMGDEGKGRFTYQFAGEGYLLVARYNGGANAGHTFEYLDQEINTHQIPSGICYDGVMNLLTNCSLFDPAAIQGEMAELDSKGIEVSPRNFGISESTSLVLPHHIMLDKAREAGSRSQGSTKRGIAQVAADKFGRSGIFFHQLVTSPDEVEHRVIEGIQAANTLLEDMGRNAWFLRQDPREAYERWLRDARSMLPYMVNTIEIVQDTIRNGDRILAEGAQSIGLDIDHGIRQENTSSLTGVAGAQQSLGIGPGHIGKVTGVAKLIKSRVGGSEDSFPTKINDPKIAKRLRGKPGAPDYEAGKSTKRLRDMGWLDMPDIHTAVELNDIGQIALTKLDVLPRAGAAVRIATHYVNKTTGTTTKRRPNHVDLMRDYEPVYKDFPTWREDITGVTDYALLPREAMDIVEAIQEMSGTEVVLIGTGPKDHQKIDLR